MTELTEREQWLELGIMLGVLSPGQQQAMMLWASGRGYRQVGIVIGISRSAARDRVQSGKDRVAVALREPREAA